MPAKSRRKRGKNLPPSKKIKAAGTSANMVGSTVASAEEKPAIVAPVISKKAAVHAADTANTYSHIKAELVTIGILAVVMLAALGILGAVL